MGDKNYLPLHPQLAPLELRVFLFSTASLAAFSETLGSDSVPTQWIDGVHQLHKLKYLKVSFMQA
jgi:hypothetical protein